MEKAENSSVRFGVVCVGRESEANPAASHQVVATGAGDGKDGGLPCAYLIRRTC
jgi:hypothetical protein